MKSPLPATLTPDQVTAVIDQDEEIPFDVTPLRSVTKHLTTGDYSILGLEKVVAIERKSLGDYLACVGGERDRFQRQVDRLMAFPVRALVIETTWPQLEAGDWRRQVTPESAIGTLIGIIAQGLPVLLAGDHARAGRYTSRLLFTAARRRWREARALVATVNGTVKPTDLSGDHVPLQPYPKD